MIARSAKPVARLVAIGALEPRELGFLPGLKTHDSFFDPITEDELAEWYGR